MTEDTNVPPPDDEEEDDDEEIALMNDTGPPDEEAQDRSPERDEDEEDEGSPEAETEEVLGKAVQALQSVSKQQERMGERLDRIERRVLKEDEPHPEDDVEFPDGQQEEAVGENPEEEEGGGAPDRYTDSGAQRHQRSSSEPADDTTDEDESKIPKSRDTFTRDEVEELLDEATSRAVSQAEERAEEVAKASTPAPPGFGRSDELQEVFQKNDNDPRKALPNLIEKAIGEDRDVSGGTFESSGRVGFRAGTKQNHFEVNKYLNKTYFGGR
jgi:hypothetical protein